MSDKQHWMSHGMWAENAVLVHLVGLCPLLAVTSTVVNALLIGAATLLVLIATNTVVSVIRHAFVPAVRIPLFVLIIASFVTSVDLLIEAWFHDLYTLIGLFIPLIVTNCMILTQAETVASRQGIFVAIRSAVGTGVGFLGVLLALGAIREALGRGTLFSGLEMLIGEAGAGLEINLPFDGALAFVLAPGAFLGLAALLALRNYLAERRSAAQGPVSES